jgi:hypothetical protein
LQQSGGFLSDWRCVDPEGVSTQENWAAINNEPYEGRTARRCNKGEYVTPGSVISHELTKSMDNKENALLDAETLNDAIAAILDAVIARFSNELTTKGLAAIDTASYDPYATSDADMGEYFPSGTRIPQTEQDFASSYMTDWLRNNPDFNIRTDITQALVDEQRTYQDKLGVYNDALNDLIKWIRQLDYCIPGPNPNWEKTTLSAIESMNSPSLENSAWWNTETASQIQSILDPAGVFGIVKGIINADEAKKAAAAYIEHALDVHIDRGQDQITDAGGILKLFESIFESYRGIINSIYFTPSNPDYDKYMPAVTTEARVEFEKIAGYEQIIADNVKKIAFLKGITTRLTNLKQDIDGLSDEEKSALDSSSNEITEFGELSSYLVSGDDIANIDRLSKEALHEKDYVKNYLLEGDSGCEKEMFNLWKTDPSTYSTYARRQVYPYPIDHLYAWFGLENPNGGGPYSVSYNDPNVDIKAMLKPRFLGGTDGNDGFLFGTFYYNAHAAPSWSCSDPLVKYIGTPVSLSMKNGDGDIGGIGAGGNEGGEYKNDCGVVTRGFEKMFHVY